MMFLQYLYHQQKYKISLRLKYCKIIEAVTFITTQVKLNTYGEYQEKLNISRKFGYFAEL